VTTNLTEKRPLGASASYAEAVRGYFEQNLKQFVGEPREGLEQVMRDGLRGSASRRRKRRSGWQAHSIRTSKSSM
jgi:hypothetical protein